MSRPSGSPSAAPTATPTLRSVDRVSAADVDLLGGPAGGRLQRKETVCRHSRTFGSGCSHRALGLWLRYGVGREAGATTGSREVATVYLTQGLHRAVQQRPNEIATICAGRTRTHAESVDRIARLAAAFRDLDLGAGDRKSVV